MDFSQDPEVTIQNAISRLSNGPWIENGDQLVIVTNAFAHDKVVESIQLRVVEI
jgi:pyruvate kinase